MNDFETTRRAALAGDMLAQHALGKMYFAGTGIAKDLNEAKKLFRAAADQGYALSQYNLGIMYTQGWGGEQSYDEATNWFRLAAEQGDEDAMFALGRIYHLLLDVGDVAQARDWYAKAAARGHKEAAATLKVLESCVDFSD